MIRVWAFLFMLLPAACLSQEAPWQKEATQGQKKVIKSNPLPVIWGPIPFTNEYRCVFEIPTSAMQSVSGGVSYLGRSPLFNAIFDGDTSANRLPKNVYEKIKVSGFRLQGIYKFYVTGKHFAPRGVYIGPHASFSRAKFDFPFQSPSFMRMNFMNINFMMGAQGILWKVIAIDFFTGVGYRYNFIEQHFFNRPVNIVRMEDMPGGGSKLSLGVNFGYSF